MKIGTGWNMKILHILQPVKDIVMIRYKSISTPLLPPLRQIPRQLDACQVNNHTV